MGIAAAAQDCTENILLLGTRPSMHMRYLYYSAFDVSLWYHVHLVAAPVCIDLKRTEARGGGVDMAAASSTSTTYQSKKRIKKDRSSMPAASGCQVKVNPEQRAVLFEWSAPCGARVWCCGVVLWWNKDKVPSTKAHELCCDARRAGTPLALDPELECKSSEYSSSISGMTSCICSPNQMCRGYAGGDVGGDGPWSTVNNNIVKTTRYVQRAANSRNDLRLVSFVAQLALSPSS